VTVRNGLLEIVAKPKKGTPQLMGLAIYGIPPPVFLCDLDEINPKVGYGQFGKKGDTGWGKRIAVKGVESPHGLSMHAMASSLGTATVSYRLGRKYRQFRGAAATNDTAQYPPPLLFKVLGDGKILWEKRFTKGPEEFVADITGVDLLTLEVACGDNPADGQAVWIEPRLSK
jgi:hypothetical protein